MSNIIVGDGLIEQAVRTSDLYFLYGVEHIDGQFGEGYAKSHPELLAAYMSSCAATAKLICDVRVTGVSFTPISRPFE